MKHMHFNPRIAECVQHMLCWYHYLNCWPCSNL